MPKATTRPRGRPAAATTPRTAPSPGAEPSALQRFRRVAAGLGIVIAAFLLYNFAIVPLVEPPDVPQGGTTASDDDIARAARALETQRARLAHWFKPGDWELTTPKIVESPQGILLVKDYRNLGDGRVEIKPCTMILVAQDAATDAERLRRAVLVRCPEGALLQFDGPFDLKQARIGRLVAGQLVGEITIDSDQKDAGPEDDLHIRVRDVAMVQQTVTSPHPVTFSLGPHRGSGQNLRVDLAPPGSGQGFQGIVALELRDNVQVRLEPDRADMFPTGDSVLPAREASAAPQPPVEIRSQGPFRFDFVENLATFNDGVDVLRVQPRGPSDQLTCNTLGLKFETISSRAATSGAPALAKLVPIRLEATGQPVVIHAPTNDVEARAQQVSYDLRTRALQMRDDYEVQLRQGHRELHGREVFYQPAAEGGWGEFWASGRGWLKATTPDGKQPVEAQWGRRVHFRPHEGQFVLSVEGAAHVQATGKGELDADDIHVWMTETQPPPQTAGDGSSLPRRERGELKPSRLLATGAVKVDSQPLTARVKELQAWFEERAAPTEPPRMPATVQAAPPGVETIPAPEPVRVMPLAGAVKSANSTGPMFPGGAMVLEIPQNEPETLPAPSSAAETIPGPMFVRPEAEEIASPRPQGGLGPMEVSARATEPQRSADQHFDIQGETLRIRFQLVGQRTELGEAVVERNVRVAETRARAADEQPLLVTGDELHMQQPESGQAVVAVKGAPAHVEARGVTMNAAIIHLDQARNLMWTENGGQLIVAGGQGLDGQPSKEPLEITWQGPFHFDGLVARFEGDVVARQQAHWLRTPLLEAAFSRPVRFAGERAGGETAARPELQEIFCRQGVEAENRAFQGAELLSIEHLLAADMRLHLATGLIEMAGPGQVLVTRLEHRSPDSKPITPFLGVSSAANQPPAAATSEKRLVRLDARFQRSLVAHRGRQDLSFEGQVRCLYAPVPSWETLLDPDRPDTWGPDGMLVSSDRMTVAQMGQAANGQKTFEFEAAGNTTIEGAAFLARAGRVTYAQSKDLLVLEGGGRGDARLFRQQTAGAAPAELAAPKIMFWPATNRVYIDDPRYLDLNELSK